MADNGPPIHANWRAMLNGVGATTMYEVPIFTDAQITGMIIEGYGPYQFLNTVPIENEFHVASPSIVARIAFHMSYTIPDLETTKDDAYHGGGLDDEIAAVISLCLGIRAHAGDRSREFGPLVDPKGLPTAPRFKRNPILPRVRGPAILPGVVGAHSLNDRLTSFAEFPKVDAEAATALIRAARLYQAAVWVAEVDPNQSWILLSSAVETAAGHWRKGEDSPLDRVRAWRPGLVDKLVAAGGEELATDVATEIANLTGATKKFLDFLTAFRPDPPTIRPPEWLQLDWSPKPFKKALEKVYSYRSDFLHAGTPFPVPMLWHPGSWGSPAFAEKSAGGGGTGVHSWTGADLPMLLHTFEYIVRGCLLNWWQSLRERG